jgi:hypothetical protein
MSLFAGLLILAAALLLFAAFVLLPVYRTYRGKRLITCPETNQPAAVDVDAVRAATSVLAGGPDLRLKDCSRWPEKAACGQECLSQVERSPGACLVRNIVAEWYRGKACFYCGKQIPQINWSEHRPGLVSPEGVTVSWTEVKPEELPSLFATHRSVCWDCHVVQSVIRERPDVVTVRPDRKHLYS